MKRKHVESGGGCIWCHGEREEEEEVCVFDKYKCDPGVCNTLSKTCLSQSTQRLFWLATPIFGGGTQKL